MPQKQQKQNICDQTSHIILFLSLLIGIYTCQLAVGILQQRIYKIPYPRDDDPSKTDFFTDQITPYASNTGIACLLCLIFTKKQQRQWEIPLWSFAKIALTDLTIQICLMTAMLRTDYTTMLVVNSTCLLSVVAVGAFFSGVKHREHPIQGSNGTTYHKSNKIEPQKLYIGLIICLGVGIFTYSSKHNHEEEQQQKPQSQNWGGLPFTILIFLVALILEGFRPDFQAQVKEQYQPSAFFFAFGVQGCVAIIVLTISIATKKMQFCVDFLNNHSAIIPQLLAYSFLFAIGNILAYKVVMNFRQHIYPLISNIRKCTTVCLNIIWYGHRLVLLQWFGISIVFTGIMIEIAHNYGLFGQTTTEINKIQSNDKHHYIVVDSDHERHEIHPDAHHYHQTVEGTALYEQRPECEESRDSDSSSQVTQGGNEDTNRHELSISYNKEIQQ